MTLGQAALGAAGGAEVAASIRNGAVRGVAFRSVNYQRRTVLRQTEVSATRRFVVMVALALGGFGIGTTEFVSMGLLDLVAADFGITEDVAGHVIAAYALGVVVGAPVITVCTGMLPRRRLLLLLTAAFVVGNAASAAAMSYDSLLVARFIAGLPHGAYFSVASLAAASMAPAGQRGRAVATVGLGLSVATVAGVPAAQWLGMAFGWAAAYALVAFIGLVCLISLWYLMPHMTLMQPTRPIVELGALANSQVWFTLAIGTVGFGGMFAVYTYITWTMRDAGLDQSWMWLVLMVYGVGMVVGNLAGGRLADRNVELGIVVSLLALLSLLVGFYFATNVSPWLAVVNFGAIGFFGSTLALSLQVRLMDVAGRAQTLASSLNHSALNTANALGAALGGAMIAGGYSYSAPALGGAVLAVLGLALWAPAFVLRRGFGTKRVTVRSRTAAAEPQTVSAV